MLWDLYVCMHLHVCVTERERTLSLVCSSVPRAQAEMTSSHCHLLGHHPLRTPLGCSSCDCVHEYVAVHGLGFVGDGKDIQGKGLGDMEKILIGRFSFLTSELIYIII